MWRLLSIKSPTGLWRLLSIKSPTGLWQLLSIKSPTGLWRLLSIKSPTGLVNGPPQAVHCFSGCFTLNQWEELEGRSLYKTDLPGISLAFPKTPLTFEEEFCRQVSTQIFSGTTPLSYIKYS